MSDRDKALFEEKRPTFDAYSAAELFYQHGWIVSMEACLSPLGDGVLVSFRSEKDVTAGPMSLNGSSKDLLPASYRSWFWSGVAAKTRR